MADENQGRDDAAIATLMERLRVELGAVALDPTAHDFLATLPEAQVDIFVEALQTTPTNLKKKLLESGMGSYFLEALQEKLITPSQGEALVAALAGRGFKIHSGTGTPFSFIPPYIEEVKAQENSAEAFQGFIREELLGKEIDNHLNALDLSPEAKADIRSEWLESFVYDVKHLVENGQISEFIKNGLYQDIEEIKRNFECHKVLEEVWGDSKAIESLPEAEQDLFAEKADLAMDLLTEVADNNALRDENGHIAEDLKEALIKLKKLDAEKTNAIVEVLENCPDLDYRRILREELKSKAGIDIDKIYEKAGKSGAGREGESPSSPENQNSLSPEQQRVLEAYNTVAGENAFTPETKGVGIKLDTVIEWVQQERLTIQPDEFDGKRDMQMHVDASLPLTEGEVERAAKLMQAMPQVDAAVEEVMPREKLAEEIGKNALMVQQSIPEEEKERLVNLQRNYLLRPLCDAAVRGQGVNSQTAALYVPMLVSLRGGRFTNSDTRLASQMYEWIAEPINAYQQELQEKENAILQAEGGEAFLEELGESEKDISELIAQEKDSKKLALLKQVEEIEEKAGIFQNYSFALRSMGTKPAGYLVSDACSQQGEAYAQAYGKAAQAVLGDVFCQNTEQWKSWYQQVSDREVEREIGSYDAMVAVGEQIEKAAIAHYLQEGKNVEEIAPLIQRYAMQEKGVGEHSLEEAVAVVKQAEWMKEMGAFISRPDNSRNHAPKENGIDEEAGKNHDVGREGGSQPSPAADTPPSRTDDKPPAAGQPPAGKPADAKDKGGKDTEEKTGLKKFMNVRNVACAAIVATFALVAALVMKNKNNDKQQAGGMGRG